MRQEIEHEFPFKVFHWISLDDQGFNYQNNLIYKVIFIKRANYFAEISRFHIFWQKCKKTIPPTKFYLEK